jgi:hypothetical protein
METTENIPVSRLTGSRMMTAITEHDWADELARIRWPGGFVCICGERRHYRFEAKPRVFACARCHRQKSVTAGTVLHGSRLPLSYWITAAALLCEDPGISARMLARALHTRVATAWHVAHRLRLSLTSTGPTTLAGLVDARCEAVSCRPSPGARGAEPEQVLTLCEVEAPEGQTPGFVAPARPSYIRGGNRRLDGPDPGKARVGRVEVCATNRWSVREDARRRCGPGVECRGVVLASGAELVRDGVRVVERPWPNAARAEHGRLRSFLGRTHRSVGRKWLAWYVAEHNVRRTPPVHGVFERLLVGALTTGRCTLEQMSALAEKLAAPLRDPWLQLAA